MSVRRPNVHDPVAGEVVPLTTEEVIARLESAQSQLPGGAVLAVDGDGTLWEPDVGDHYADWLVTGGHLRPEGVEALAALARRLGVDDGTAMVEALHARWLNGGMRDEEICYAGAVALAGMDLQDAVALARRALAELPGGLVPLPGWAPVLAWAREVGVEVWVVSAGTWPMASVAAAALGIPADRVLGALPECRSGRLGATIAGPLPVGEGKIARLRAATGGRPVLAAFGNDLPDAALLAAASVAIAVRPTPTLCAARPNLPWWDPGDGLI